MGQMEERVSLLERSEQDIKAKLDEMAKTNVSIAKSISAFAEGQKSIVKAIDKLSENMERFRAFEVKTEAERRAEREHRERVDRRIDELQVSIKELRNEMDAGQDNVYAYIRATTDELKDRISDINTKLAVKVGVDTEKQKVVEKTLEKGGERTWKLLFWLLTFLIAAYFASSK